LQRAAKQHDIAFALAGLGGFNAHGAGFLAAASKCNVVPDLITATSGQIVVAADWLQHEDLEKSLVDPELEHDLFAQLAIALSGDPGVFRPAYFEMIKRWFAPPRFYENPFKALANRLLPAQLYVSMRSAADFAKIAKVFNEKARIGDHKIGIVFNAYDLKSGEAVLFGNDQARALWEPEKSIPRAAKPGAGNRPVPEAKLLPITAEAVESALWLSLYGFDHLPNGLMDGAYNRSCIVSELHTFKRIFVARPLAQGWRAYGRGPRNWFEAQDWQTEMWFSTSYKAEVATLNQINDLIDNHYFKDRDHPFKKVELIEIAPETPAGFFNYFIERKSVYDRAYKDAVALFSALKLGSPAPVGS
jgi:hypothetical protein